MKSGGDDLHFGRKCARLLAVQIQQDPLLRRGKHPFPRQHGDLADGPDLPCVELGEVPEDQREDHCADDGHMEEAVVGHGVGGDEHASPVVAPVGDGDIEHIHGPLVPIVHLETDPFLPVGEKGGQRPPDEGEERSAGLAGPVDPVHDLSSEAEARDIVKVSCGRKALVVPVADASEIDGVDITLPDGEEGCLQPSGDGHGPAEIAARSVGEKAEHGVAPEGAVLIEKAVDHLVERAVATHADDPVGPRQEVIPGYPGGIARPSGQVGLEGPQKIPGHVPDPGPLFARRPVSRMRIHHKDSLAGIQVHLLRLG